MPYTNKKNQAVNRKKHTAKQKARRISLKQKCIDYLGGECQRQSCKYKNCRQALVFHHINPEDKKFSISQAYKYDWLTIRAELDKCLLLCSNCHAEMHEFLALLDKRKYTVRYYWTNTSDTFDPLFGCGAEEMFG